jgi:hypothetical protein
MPLLWGCFRLRLLAAVGSFPGAFAADATKDIVSLAESVQALYERMDGATTTTSADHELPDFRRPQ